MENKIIEDSQLGEVLFRKNIRAKRYIIRIKGQTVTVTIPRSGTFKVAHDFFLRNRNAVIQNIKDTGIEEKTSPRENEFLLRQQAQQILPGTLKQLASKHGFTYQKVTIRGSKTRWGSCSSQKNISLSYFLMTLPPHLIEYVLLHELCHTIEMNHSPAFWNLLNKHTNGDAKELRKELRTYRL